MMSAAAACRRPAEQQRELTTASCRQEDRDKHCQQLFLHLQITLRRLDLVICRLGRFVVPSVYRAACRSCGKI